MIFCQLAGSTALDLACENRRVHTVLFLGINLVCVFEWMMDERGLHTGHYHNLAECSLHLGHFTTIEQEYLVVVL